jgi:hypothetical protein
MDNVHKHDIYLVTPCSLVGIYQSFGSIYLLGGGRFFRHVGEHDVKTQMTTIQIIAVRKVSHIQP